MAVAARRLPRRGACPSLSSSKGPISSWHIFMVHAFILFHQVDSLNYGQDTILLPEISPNTAPRLFDPPLAPSPLAPFTNTSTPTLSGKCTLNFSSAEALISTTAVDCWASFAPFLANVICCPQLQATLATLIGQSSKETGLLVLDPGHGEYCLSDVQQILQSRGASDSLLELCSMQSSNLTESSCPVNDVNGFERVVDSSKLLAACDKVDPVNECCSQLCQNSILDAARNLASIVGSLPRAEIVLHGKPSIIDDCRTIVLRWLSSRLDPLTSAQLLRRLANCNVNGVCPLAFPDAAIVAEDCENMIKNQTACCRSMGNYISHLQKQSFITNLQALDCASMLGLQLLKMNITTNIYSLCHITLKDFSLQVGSQESGCLLPSLPSDATFDSFSGIGFTCDLNDNIAAPWPSASRTLPPPCDKALKVPALPAATSAQLGKFVGGSKALMLTDLVLAFSFF